MHIFIDESGTSAPPASDPSISTVGALIVPDSILPGIERKYARLREELPKHNGEVKGRLLNEHEINNVVTMLRRHQILFEVAAIDMAVHAANERRRRRGDRWRQDAIGQRRCQHAVDARLDRRAMGGDPAEEEVSLVTFGGRASNF